MAISKEIRDEAEALGVKLDSRWNDAKALKEIKKHVIEPEPFEDGSPEEKSQKEDGMIGIIDDNKGEEDEKIIRVSKEENPEYPKSMNLKNLTSNVKSFVSFEIPARGEVTVSVKDERTMRRILRAIETKQIQEV